MICPNLSIPDIKVEFNELKSVLGEDMAYLMWSRNNGFHLDKTRDGKPSKLFNDLLGLTDRKNAIEIKAKTLSNSFKNWFGESKVVDENGEPLIVYHSSPNNFEVFRKEKKYFPLDEKSYFFTPDKDYSMQYGKNVYPVFFKSEKLNQMVDDEVEHASVWEYKRDNADLEFDGIVGKESAKRPVTSYVVFESNQIKSIFNSGVFNRYSDNIYDNEMLQKEQNRQQTQINGSMSQDILSNFENYFPDYTYLNDEQRQVLANLVEEGRINLSCSI